MDAALFRAQVLAAFACVPKPLVIAPHRCPECDEIAQALESFSAENLPDYVFEKHVWDLPFLSDEAKHYYLPAWLVRAASTESWNACDALVYALESDHRWSPVPPYTESQWLAIDAALEGAVEGSDPATVENVERARRCIPR